jgi:hypothetical protein
MILTLGWTVVGLRTHPVFVDVFVGMASALFFLLCQLTLVRRMVRKKYRSFRLEVVRPSRPEAATLTIVEAARIWLKIIWPQVCFYVAVWLVEFWLGNRLSADTTRAIPTLAQWGLILVIGPFGVHRAVTSKYPTFRPKAVGERFA